MDKILEKLIKQEAILVKEQQSHLYEGKIKLSPKIDIEKNLTMDILLLMTMKKRINRYGYLF